MLSRHMPAAPEYKVTPLVYACRLAVALLIGLLCWHHPVAMPIILTLAGLVWVGSIVEGKRLNRIAAKRPEDSICAFARSFDCRNVDTRIIRAVYEEIQRYLKGSHNRFPIRASDQIDEDLRIDREDLDDICYDVAARTGYDMANTKANPLFDKVNTVEDMVLFFTHQPKIQTGRTNGCSHC